MSDNDTNRLLVELKLLRAAVFAESPEIANRYRSLIVDILESSVEIDADLLEHLSTLAAEANEAVGVRSFG